MWQEYGRRYAKLEDARAGAAKAADKRRAALGRKLEALQRQGGEALRAAEQEIRAVQAQSSKLPGLAALLRSLT